MSIDILQKRGKFIGKVNSLLQEFHYVKPDILTKLVSIYATSFYGSGLWSLLSTECNKLFANWNVSMRQIFSLPRRTHRYLIKPVSLCCHPKVMLAEILVTFFKSLINSNKFAVRFLARLCQGDQRTVAGKTLTLLEEVCEMNGLGADSMTANTIKRNVQYFNAPVGEEWRAPLIR